MLQANSCEYDDSMRSRFKPICQSRNRQLDDIIKCVHLDKSGAVKKIANGFTLLLRCDFRIQPINDILVVFMNKSSLVVFMNKSMSGQL